MYIRRGTTARKLAIANRGYISGSAQVLGDAPNWLLKDVATFLADSVCAIFNSSVRQGDVPKHWKQANVIPVPKIHPPKLVENDLRPIVSLTATLSKILESFVGGWILGAVAWPSAWY